jgi:mRNA-degrading endonuclease toxin of MazEF toxin-antitoxin module
VRNDRAGTCLPPRRPPAPAATRPPRAPSPAARQGEIWFASLDPVQGREQAARRPVLIVSVDQLGTGPSQLAIVAPLTSRDHNQRIHVGLEPPEGGVRAPRDHARAGPRDRAPEVRRAMGSSSPEHARAGHSPDSPADARTCVARRRSSMPLLPAHPSARRSNAPPRVSGPWRWIYSTAGIRLTDVRLQGVGAAHTPGPADRR